jgi:hypothetical protein
MDWSPEQKSRLFYQTRQRRPLLDRAEEADQKNAIEAN